tara:strand:- start:204 stop:809 length:606 start_codon:yes stop_codon:yes gene_type:complete
MEKNIIGGVSPLRRKSMRRGKSYGKGKRGAGDTRYKRDKWVPPASGGTVTTPSGKAPPNPAKPYTMGKDGMVMNDPFATKKWHDGTPGATTTEETLKKSNSGTEIGSWDYDGQGRNPTYDEAWEINLENVQDKYTDLDDYKNKETARKDAGEKGASKEDIHKSIYETKTVTREGTDGHWKYYDEDGGEISKGEYSKYKNKR